MRRFALLVLTVGVLAWFIVGGLLLIDAGNPFVTEPTLVPVAPTRIAFRPTMTFTPTDTPRPPSVTPTLIPSQTPLVVTAAPIKTTLPPPSPPTPLSVVYPSDMVTPLSTNRAAAESGAATLSTPASGTACALPAGWVPHSVEQGDTLFGFQLGAKGSATVDQIMQGNCLKSKLLVLNQVVYLPPGAAENAPKVDDSPQDAPMPAGLTRKANCPCTLAIRSGWRREQIASAIDKVPVGFTGGDFLAVTSGSAPLDGFGFLGDKPAGAPLEGFLFPGSYNLDNATTAQQFRDQLLRAFDANVSARLRGDAAAHGLSFYQALVFASIVQRESYSAIEQPKIASVMYNRMAAGKAISSTVTVQYAIGQAGNWWPKVTGADLKNRSRYNTYIWLGLPPTPISNPDLSALSSSIYPAQTDFQYYAASCDAPGNFYTRTFEEFNAILKRCAGQ